LQSYNAIDVTVNTVRRKASYKILHRAMDSGEFFANLEHDCHVWVSIGARESAKYYLDLVAVQDGR